MSTTHLVTEFFVDIAEPAYSGFREVQAKIEETQIRTAPIQGFLDFEAETSRAGLASAHAALEGEAVA